MRGVKNIVASLGTSLTQEQIKLLKRFCSKVVLVFDSDNAGEAAMLRTINLLLENQLEVKIVSLPQGEDPDSVVRKKGKDHFIKLVGQSLDFFDYKLKVLNNKFNQEDIEEKSKIAENMLTTLDKISSEIKRYQYISKLARCLELDQEVVVSEYRKKFSKKAGRKYSGQSFFSQKENYRKMPSVTEKILLKAMFENPKIFILMQKNFNGEDFTHPLARKIVNFLFKNYLQKNKAAKELLADIDDPIISGFISQIILEDEIPQDENTIKESLVRMHKKHTDRQKDKLRLKIKNAESKEAREKLEKELIAKYSKGNSEVRDE
jgi:DNA primase